MEQFFQRMHVRRESLKREELSKKDQWREDEIQVREGVCQFPVKYLGYTEVSESKGPDVCRQSYHKLKYEGQCHTLASLFQRQHRRVSIDHRIAALFISADGVKIADENEDVLVDTRVKAITFCCPVNGTDRGFAYICSSGEAPFMWHCHVMEALYDHGDRLTNAVGAAFKVCFERQFLDSRGRRGSNEPKEDPGSQHRTTGAFRQIPLAEKQLDPQAGIIAEPVPRRTPDGPPLSSVDRPRGPTELKQKKAVALTGIMEAHPYKRLAAESPTSPTAAKSQTWTEEEGEEEVVELHNVADK